MIGLDAVGFGALNIDRLFRVNRIASVEEESFVADFEEACGGSAANTMVGLARLGCRTGFIGKVAEDREGKMLLEDFCREGVDTRGIIVTRQGRTGAVMGFVDKRGERALYVDPGVNDTIRFDEISRDFAFKAHFLHLTSFVGEKSFQAQMKLVGALPPDVKLSLDPGELYARRGRSMEPIFQKTFVFMPNVKELEILTDTENVRKGAAVLLEKGVKIVAVKLGGKGCYVTDSKESHVIEPFEVRVVDTTGAGDAFCAGFLYGLISRKTLYKCGVIGNFVASKCITQMGARPGLPNIEDLKPLLQIIN